MTKELVLDTEHHGFCYSNAFKPKRGKLIANMVSQGSTKLILRSLKELEVNASQIQTNMTTPRFLSDSMPHNSTRCNLIESEIANVYDRQAALHVTSIHTSAQITKPGGGDLTPTFTARSGATRSAALSRHKDMVTTPRDHRSNDKRTAVR